MCVLSRKKFRLFLCWYLTQTTCQNLNLLYRFNKMFLNRPLPVCIESRALKVLNNNNRGWSEAEPTE